MSFWPENAEVMNRGLESTLNSALPNQRWPVFFLMAIAFFLPFERIGSYDLASVTVRVSQILILIFLIYFLFYFLTGRQKIFSNIALWTLFLFIGSSLISTINALNPERAVMISAFTAFTFCLPILLVSYLKKKKDLEKIVAALLLGSLVVSLFGLYQFWGDTAGLSTSITGLRPQYSKAILGFPRIQSTALEPLYFANYLLIPLSFGLAIIFSKISNKKRIYLAIFLILIIVNLVLTASRGGIIAAIISAAMVTIFLKPKIFSPKTIIGVVIFLGSVLLVSTALSADSSDPFQSNLDKFVGHVTTLTKGAAIEERLNNYLPAWRIWQENFWFGIGPGNFGPAMALHPYVQPREGWKIVNNEFLELLAENGLVGLSVILLFHLLLFYQAIKAFKRAEPELKPLIAAAIAAWVGIWIQYQTFSVLYITHVWFLAGLLLAIVSIKNPLTTKQSSHLLTISYPMLK